jgi:hypothetical protein
MSLLPFFQWCYQTAVGEAIRESLWLFPLIEAFHLVGLGLTVGAVLIVDLRLLGAGLTRHSVAQLAAAVEPWLLGSVTLMFVSGIPFFLSESMKCYYSFAFWVMMTSLFLVLLSTFTVRRRQSGSARMLLIHVKCCRSGASARLSPRRIELRHV